VREIFQNIAMNVVDAVMAIIPRAAPSRASLEVCKIVSHRGEHDNDTILENTLAAYEQARAVSVWGIEGDIRFTADLVPVICHDATTERVFGESIAVADTSFEELRRRLPQIPSLDEVIAQFGGSTHLMLEIKDEPRPDAAAQKQKLQSLLGPLEPVRDFHMLALNPALFEIVDFLPKAALLPVAELNTAAMSRASLANDLAGLAGHYLLMTGQVLQQHRARGQKIGTGFPASKHCLFRELNRGVEWIFTNEAVKLQRIRDRQLSRSR